MSSYGLWSAQYVFCWRGGPYGSFLYHGLAESDVYTWAVAEAGVLLRSRPDPHIHYPHNKDLGRVVLVE